jgi:hypothetical protein
MKAFALGVATSIALIGTSARAASAPSSPEIFALVIGVNQSVDARQPPLRYADDDAARYRDLFRALGARTYLLSRLDDNTRTLHPDAAGEAILPRSTELTATVTRLAADVAAARARGAGAMLYVVYAGHGSVEGEHGYLTLEDRRVTGADLAVEVFDRIRADRSHLIVDACSSYLVVLGRGRGGERQPLHGFTEERESILRRRDVGFLLSTSSARESFEWSAFEAGVFNHEVRSGLLGAADADGDGLITYAEIAAFIRRANEGVPNERYRPEVFWRPPAGADTLVDLRTALERRVEIPRRDHGRYYLEDARGVRLADFHSGPRSTVRLVRPRGASRLYLHRETDDREFVLGDAPAVASTADATPVAPRVSRRGAADEAFNGLFALPFDGGGVTNVGSRITTGDPEESPRRAGGGRTVGLALIGAALPAAAVGTWAFVSARILRDRVDARAMQTEVADSNRQIRDRNTIGAVALSVAGTAALTGLVLWLRDVPPVTILASSTAATVVWGKHF